MRVISSDSGWGLKKAISFMGLFSVALVGLWAVKARTGESARVAKGVVPASVSGRVMAQYTKLPMRFERNQGQVNPQVKYVARGRGYNLFLTPAEAVLTLKKSGAATTTASKSAGAVLRMKLAGANPGALVAGANELPGRSNYFIGNDPSKWHTDVPAYARVRYSGVYRGVDVVYYGRQGQLENDFVVSAGSDAGQIRLNIAGAQKLAVDKSGDLVMSAGGGEVRFQRPVAYQEVDGRRKQVEAGYELAGAGEVKFKLGPYDRDSELVIDPVLIYATYLGGTGGDVAYGIAVDSAGEAFVTGNTNSSDFPLLGSEQGSNLGAGDAFVAKLNSSGTALLYSTYLGGNNSDTGTGIAVSASGDAFVIGTTSSSNFPTTSTAFQTTYGGNGDAFVTQLNSTGGSLVYSSFLGGGGADFGQAIALDSSGNAYVAGSTQSVNFPLLNPFQPTSNGGSDAFVAKVNFDGTALLYSTYLGGAQADVAQGIKVDSSQNIYVTGYTFSPDFPLKNPIQGIIAGGPDAFVTKIDHVGATLIFSTFLGGSQDDRAFGIALDTSGNVYVAGVTGSSDFPTSSAYQGARKGSNDAFVCKLNSGGATLLYSTYLGGSGVDQANGIAVDSTGSAYVTGFTESSDFPTQQAVQGILGITGGSLCGVNPCSDAFVTQLNAAGTGLTYSTFVGGSGADFGQGIAVDSTGGVYIGGSTASSNFPATAGTKQSELAGVAGNAFVAKIGPASLPSLAMTPATLNFGTQPLNVRSATQTVSVTNEGTAPLNIVSIIPAGDFQESDDCLGTISSSGGTCTISVTYTPTALGAVQDQISITDNSFGSPHTITVTGTGVSALTAVTLTPTSLTFGNQKVGTLSPAQTVTITNTGTATLTINQISTTGAYVQTNTCGAVLNVLNVGQSCVVSVSFQPTASGALNGSLSIADNASGSPQSVALSGTGTAVFSLGATATSTTIPVGTASTTYTINATGDSGFGGSITLSCSAGITCTFNPTAILVGQTSTLTATGLSATSPNPYNFTVAGVSGSQNATEILTVLTADFTLTGSPALNTIVSGGSATYSVAVTPTNGFNQPVQMSCANLPAGATCSFSQSSVTPNGSAATTTMTVFTNKVASVPPGPGSPFPGAPPFMFWLASAALLGALHYLLRRRRSVAAPGRPVLSWKFSALALALFFLAGLTGCRPSTTTSNTGTTPGNYTISIVGTLGSNTSVQRTTTVNLSVT